MPITAFNHQEQLALLWGRDVYVERWFVPDRALIVLHYQSIEEW